MVRYAARRLSSPFECALWAVGLLLLPGASPADESAFAAALAQGDAEYARRADGAVGPNASPVRIDEAVAAYRRALSLDPESSEARFKLMRALFFRGVFCGADPGRVRAIFEEAKRVGEEGIERLEKKGKKTPAAAPLYFWTAVSWGQWALVRGKFAAARQGAGGRIRDLGQTVIDLDPELEQGGGYRILGRLHDQSPRIPFLTGWVSREKALSNLRKALEAGPQNTVNQFFLAEAILEHDPSRKEEARRLLALCGGSAPREAYRVEDAYYAELSRKRLAELR